MSKWQLTLTDTQAIIIKDALDMYSRVGMGQIKAILDHPDITERLLDKGHSRWGEVGDTLDVFKQEVFDLDKSGYYGIFSEDIKECNREAWDVQQVIRHGIAWDKYPEGGLGVSWDTPFQASKQDLPEFIKIED